MTFNTNKFGSRTVYPPARIGFLGGGQLERMCLLAGRRMGYQFRIYAPGGEQSASCVADHATEGDYDDEEQLSLFADGLALVTCQFENIPARTLEFLENVLPVFPSSKAMRICQNRRVEKEFLHENGFPLPRNGSVRSLSDLIDGVRELGTPCLLKRASFGYDGKGQYKIEKDTDLQALWTEFKFPAGTLEEWVDFAAEYSVIVGRAADGTCSTFPVARNLHRNNILHMTSVPSGLPEEVEKEVCRIACSIADKLEIVGLLTVEFFRTNDGRWLVNELAPRAHNSGHFSFDACLTSQFEQHLRLICGLPPGTARLLNPVCMINLLGDLWKKGTPDWNQILRVPDAKLHLYGKEEPREGRKMGHFCVLSDTVEEATRRAEEIYQNLLP
jgi:5-(carboxyamino)imidazole ribonucleotide synthase